MSDLQRLRNRAIMSLGNHPRAFFLLVGLRRRFGLGQGMMTITPDTDIVIEGFLRCANSFATRAFIEAQPSPVSVANRTHVPATIIRAARLNLPTLVLIREPKDVVVSYMMKRPYITARDGFREYINYYKRIAPYREHYVVASFEDVTTDFGEVIERVNERFGTTFTPFVHTDENVQKVFAIVERNDRAQVGDDLSRISVPLPERERFKAQIRDRILDERIQPLVREAEAIYRWFTAEPVDLEKFATRKSAESLERV